MHDVFACVFVLAAQHVLDIWQYPSEQSNETLSYINDLACDHLHMTFRGQHNAARSACVCHVRGLYLERAQK